MMLDGGHGSLSSALKTLRAKWDSTEGQWTDAMRQRFVEAVWEPLQDHTTQALQAMDQLQTLLFQMRHECLGDQEDLLSGN